MQLYGHAQLNLAIMANLKSCPLKTMNFNVQTDSLQALIQGLDGVPRVFHPESALSCKAQISILMAWASNSGCQKAT